MDNILSWNVRGLNEQARKFEIRSLLRNNKVSIAGLLETRVLYCNFKKLLRSLDDFDYIENYDDCYNGHLLVISF